MYEREWFGEMVVFAMGMLPLLGVIIWAYFDELKNLMKRNKENQENEE